MTKNKLKTFIKLADISLSMLYSGFLPKKKSLSIFLFHALFWNKREKDLNLIDPRLGITVSDFRRFVDYYLNHGYRFISANEILNSSKLDENQALITFDDGYANNLLALPILNEFQVPATFFISTNYVKNNKCFWWDILYRERRKAGLSYNEIYEEQQSLKSKKYNHIEEYITRLFGKIAFTPASEIDRPLTPAELKACSHSQYLTIGNHTSDHINLTICSNSEIKFQIMDAQDFIKNTTGKSPSVISYPFGSYSNEIINIAKDSGLKLGISINTMKNDLPINLEGEKCMRMGRFTMSAETDIRIQLKFFDSSMLLMNSLKKKISNSY
ncbi:MAG: polysaccharide deacetylase family protein [Elusimicrobia bacterium]|nr:polysaccharide deacetylase family protein [Elusimicrobiota bacterium]